MISARHLAMLALLVPAGAQASDGLSCKAVSRLSCDRTGDCTEPADASREVQFWPERTATYECRASRCPEMPPWIRLCDETGCAHGAVDYGFHPTAFDLGPLQAVATLAPEQPLGLLASRLYALSWDSDRSRLALSRFDHDGVETTWFDCVPEPEEVAE